MILPDVVWHVFSAGSGGYTKVRRGGGEEAGGGGGESEGVGMHSHAIMLQQTVAAKFFHRRFSKKHVWIYTNVSLTASWVRLILNALLPTGCTIISPK